MTTVQLIQLILSIVSLIGLVVGFWVTLWRLAKKTGELKVIVCDSLEFIRALFKSVTRTQSALLASGHIKSKDYEEIARPFVDKSAGGLEKLIAQVKPKGNPLTAEEFEIIKNLFNKILHRKDLSYTEAKQLLELTLKVEEELPDDLATLTLLEIASTTFGKAIAARKKKKPESAKSKTP